MKQRRGKLGISQHLLGQRVGVAQSIIARIETGKRPLTDSMQKMLDRAFAEVEAEGANYDRQRRLARRALP